VQDVGAALVIFAANFCEIDPPRGSVQQAHAERLFERPNVVADHSRGHFQAARGGAETAAIRDPDEGFDPGEPVHAPDYPFSVVDNAFSAYLIVQVTRKPHFVAQELTPERRDGRADT